MKLRIDKVELDEPIIGMIIDIRHYQILVSVLSDVTDIISVSMIIEKKNTH